MFDTSDNSAARELENTTGVHKHFSWPHAQIQMLRETLLRLIWPALNTGSEWRRSYQNPSGKE
jgi:hypothetical protein